MELATESVVLLIILVSKPCSAAEFVLHELNQLTCSLYKTHTPFKIDLLFLIVWWLYHIWNHTLSVRSHDTRRCSRTTQSVQKARKHRKPFHAARCFWKDRRSNETVSVTEVKMFTGNSKTFTRSLTVKEFFGGKNRREIHVLTRAYFLFLSVSFRSNNQQILPSL